MNALIIITMLSIVSARYDDEYLPCFGPLARYRKTPCKSPVVNNAKPIGHTNVSILIQSLKKASNKL